MCSSCSGDYENPDATAEDPTCESCGHPLYYHGGKEGCGYESDTLDGSRAKPPCGCTGHCEHRFVRWDGSRGEFRCLTCDRRVDIPELTEAMPEIGTPYDLIVEQ